jgi:uridine kinase
VTSEIHPRLSAYCRSFALGLRPRNIVLIGGLSRSGKTTFGHALRAAVLEQGYTAWTLSLDRWLKDLDSRLPGVLGRYDLSIISRVIDRHTSESTDAQVLRLPEYDKLQQRTHYTGESILILPEDVLIIEGTVALTLPNDSCQIHRYFVDIDESKRRRRVIEEYILRGKTEAQAEAIYSAREFDESPVVLRSSIDSTHVDIMELCSWVW